MPMLEHPVAVRLKVPSTEVKRAMRIKDGNLDIGMIHYHLREVDQVVDKSRVPQLDVAHSEVDAAKTRLEEALVGVGDAATDLRRLDRQRRRAETAAARSAERAEGDVEVDPVST